MDWLRIHRPHTDPDGRWLERCRRSPPRQCITHDRSDSCECALNNAKKETVMFEQKFLRKDFIAILAATAIALAGCGNKPSNEQNAAPSGNASGKYTISTRIDPNPPAGGKENTIHVTVQDGT